MYNANMGVQPDLFRIDQRGRKKNWVGKKGFLVKKNHGVPDIQTENKTARSKMYEPYTMLG